MMFWNSVLSKSRIFGAVILMLLLCIGLVIAAGSLRLGKDGVVLREGPGNYYKMAAILDANTEMTLQDSSRGWVKVQVINGSLGWISSNVFAPTPAAATPGRGGSAPRNIGVDRTAVGAMIKGLKQGVSASSQALAVDIGGGNVDTAAVSSFRGQFNPAPLTGERPISANEAGLSLYPQLLAVSPVIAATLIDEWGGRNRSYEAYANQIVLWVADRIGAGNLTPQVYVTMGGEDAVCLPGGWIIVGGGLFTRVQDESELAGILSHELAHAVFQHGRKGFAKQSYRIGIKNTFDELDEETFEEDIDTVDTSDLQGFADDVRATAIRKSSVGDEIQADSAAICWLAASGYDPNALKRFLERVRGGAGSQLTGRGGEVTTNWLSSRRELDQRINAAGKNVKQIPSASIRAGQQFADRYRRSVR